MVYLVFLYFLDRNIFFISWLYIYWYGLSVFVSVGGNWKVRVFYFLGFFVDIKNLLYLILRGNYLGGS